MAKRDFTGEFQKMMIAEASRDRRLRGTLEWLIKGETDLVSKRFLDDVDEADLAADIAEYYALDPDSTRQAFELCEQQIEKGLHHDQA